MVICLSFRAFWSKDSDRGSYLLMQWLVMISSDSIYSVLLILNGQNQHSVDERSGGGGRRWKARTPAPPPSSAPVDGATLMVDPIICRSMQLNFFHTTDDTGYSQILFVTRKYYLKKNNDRRLKPKPNYAETLQILPSGFSMWLPHVMWYKFQQYSIFMPNFTSKSDSTLDTTSGGSWYEAVVVCQ